MTEINRGLLNHRGNHKNKKRKSHDGIGKRNNQKINRKKNILGKN